MPESALSTTRARDFPEWYQALVHEADFAEVSPTRGCMIIKAWGYGLWEQIQAELDRRIKATGHENYYFPLLIPMSFIAKEAEHVEGFAKEMAVVTHHRLKATDGVLKPDPDAELAEPLIIRPTSETIIGDAFSRWVKSHRDLPLLLNQWANVVRWEMRTRLFLRTTEFLWQEGHTAHADGEGAMSETLAMLEMYRSFAEDVLAMPVVAGEKTENERFPGALRTYSIEAMMQDGKALQAGTSHYFGTHFAEAQNIRYQDKEGGRTLAHTTSWGVSTRLIGGAIMTHGDDDGFRAPPAVAPKQITIIPILRGRPEDAELMTYCMALRTELGAKTAFGAAVRVHVDAKDAKPIEKRWDWVRRGVPIICEIGQRDSSSQQVGFMLRNALRNQDKIATQTLPRSEFLNRVTDILEAMQQELFSEAKDRMNKNILADLRTFGDIENYYGAHDDGSFKGWIQVPWSRPTGSALTEIADRLKALKLTIRNAPLDQVPGLRNCVFTGRPGVEEVLIGRSY